jgi:hypothetical protein
MTRTCFVFYLALLGPLFLFPNIVFSQEQLGMRLERRAGMYAAAINPANTAINPNNWEVSLFSKQLCLPAIGQFDAGPAQFRQHRVCRGYDA